MGKSIHLAGLRKLEGAFPSVGKTPNGCLCKTENLFGAIVYPKLGGQKSKHTFGKFLP